MKKTLLLSLLLFKAISCSSEINDNDVNTIDPIIGVWVHIDYSESKMTVQQNGRIIVANYIEAGECNGVYSPNLEMTWKNNQSNPNFNKILQEYQVIYLGSSQQCQDENDIISVVFSDDFSEINVSNPDFIFEGFRE